MPKKGEDRLHGLLKQIAEHEALALRYLHGKQKNGCRYPGDDIFVRDISHANFQALILCLAQTQHKAILAYKNKLIKI